MKVLINSKEYPKEEILNYLWENDSCIINLVGNKIERVYDPSKNFYETLQRFLD